jgi:ANTAR domain
MTDDIMTIARELVEVTRLVEADDFGATLDRFVRRIVRTIPGCTAATITIRSSEAVETVASAGEVPLDPLVPGPIIEALTFAEPRRLENADTDQRWPAFSARLVNAGFHGCQVLPLSTDSPDSAVLTLYSSEPDQLTEIGFDVVLLLTLHAGVMFDNASLYHDSYELVGQLRAALRTRSLIGRAQGLLMRHFGHDSERAFNALRRTSQNANLKLRDVAIQLVTAHEDGTFEAAVKKLSVSA